MKIVLYSGGLDSYIGYWLLRRENDDWVPVYFDLQTRYSQKELTHIRRLPQIEGGRIPTLEIRTRLNLRHIERDDGYIPQRNVLLCAAAQALYDASDIALCSVADDVYADNSHGFHVAMSQLLTLTAGHEVRVFSPLMWLGGTWMFRTKAEAVALYLKEGGDANALRATVSCYDPVEVSCGHCTACVRRREALEANGITL